ncbi:MAG: hypothetical protein AAGA67_06680 [Cyanobacteria bacterium P01_F01_bin.153]
MRLIKNFSLSPNDKTNPFHHVAAGIVNTAFHLSVNTLAISVAGWLVVSAFDIAAEFSFVQAFAIAFVGEIAFRAISKEEV